MGALSSDNVGAYVNANFVTAYQKVGTFQVVKNGNGGLQKNGGNVASYFCRPDGRVIHAVAGPVDADRFLSEARFAVEIHKMALTAAAIEKDRKWVNASYNLVPPPQKAEEKRTRLELAYLKTIHAAHVDRLRDGFGYANAKEQFAYVHPDTNLNDSPLRVQLYHGAGMWNPRMGGIPPKKKPGKNGIWAELVADNKLDGAAGDRQQELVCRMLAGYPLAGIDKLGPVVWSKILGERWSAAPVAVK